MLLLIIDSKLKIVLFENGQNGKIDVHAWLQDDASTQCSKVGSEPVMDYSSEFTTHKVGCFAFP